MIEQERVETAITALENIGDALPGELTPNPANYSAAEKFKIVCDHTENVRRLSLWQDIVLGIPPGDCDLKIFYLEELLNRRVHEISSILMSLLERVN